MARTVPSVAAPGCELKIEVEVNVPEREPRFECQHSPFAFGFRGKILSTPIASFNINKMLATKIGAIFQRKKGRDLFDLHWAITDKVIDTFTYYVREESIQYHAASSRNTSA